MDRSDEDTDRQERDLEFVQAMVRTRLAPVTELYKQLLTYLWLGNGAAAGGMLSLMNEALKESASKKLLFWPLVFFVIGVGTAFHLISEARAIRSMEEASGPWQLKIGLAKRPSETAGLAISDWRTRAAVVSAACFAIGCVSGLYEIWIQR
jgi:hypothetical protein